MQQQEKTTTTSLQRFRLRQPPDLESKLPSLEINPLFDFVLNYTQINLNFIANKNCQMGKCKQYKLRRCQICLTFFFFLFSRVNRSQLQEKSFFFILFDRIGIQIQFRLSIPNTLKYFLILIKSCVVFYCCRSTPHKSHWHSFLL